MVYYWFGDEYGDVFVVVVYCKGMVDEVWNDGWLMWLGFDDLFGVFFVLDIDFFE